MYVLKFVTRSIKYFIDLQKKTKAEKTDMREMATVL